MDSQKDLKSMKKVSIGSKVKGKLIQNVLHLLNNTFGWKIRPNLGHRQTDFFCIKRGPIGLCWCIK